MIIPLPPGEFRAYLFDCDGTIADSMPLHYRAWEQALGEWNCSFPEDLFYAWGGRPVADIIASLNESQGLAMPVEAVARRRESLYQELLPGSRPFRGSCRTSRTPTGAYRRPSFPAAPAIPSPCH
ncbi:HAD family hydrolase [Streptomyces nojiriensis]